MSSNPFDIDPNAPVQRDYSNLFDRVKRRLETPGEDFTTEALARSYTYIQNALSAPVRLRPRPAEPEHMLFHPHTGYIDVVQVKREDHTINASRSGVRAWRTWNWKPYACGAIRWVREPGLEAWALDPSLCVDLRKPLGSPERYRL